MSSIIEESSKIVSLDNEESLGIMGSATKMSLAARQPRNNGLNHKESPKIMSFNNEESS